MRVLGTLEPTEWLDVRKNNLATVLWVAAGLLVLTASSYCVAWVSWFRFSLALLALAVVVSVVALSQVKKQPVTAPLQGRSMRSCVLLCILIVVHCVTAFLLERSVKGEDIDCYTFQRDSVKTLLHGGDPYGQTEANVYSAHDTALYYAPGMVKDGRVQVGFQYPPLTLLWAIPGYLLGDVRYSYVLAVVLSAVMCFLAYPGKAGLWLSSFLLVNPIAFNVENRCWTEPMVFLCLCVAIYAAVRRRWWLPVAVGLFLATKQYNFLALPFLGYLTGVTGWKPYLRLLGLSLLVAASTALPFAAWNFGSLWHDMVLFHLAQPFRADALSFAVVYPALIKYGPLLVLAYMVWSLRVGMHRTAMFVAGYSGSLLVFVATSKQAFCNYYFLIGQGLLLAGAGLYGSSVAKKPTIQAC